jgi:hypothetical protein
VCFLEEGWRKFSGEVALEMRSKEVNLGPGKRGGRGQQGPCEAGTTVTLHSVTHSLAKGVT